MLPKRPAANEPVGTDPFMDHKENSRQQCSQEAARHPLPPQGPFAPPQGPAWGHCFCFRHSYVPYPRKNGVPGRIPNERGPFSFTFSMKSSVHYLLKSQLDNFLIRQVSIRYTESSLHDYQHLLEHSFQWWVNQPAVCGFPVNSVWCLFNKCWILSFSQQREGIKS